MSDNTLDLDKYLATLEKPSLTLHGETYVCEYPSFNDRLKLERHLEGVNWDDPESAQEGVQIFSDYFDVPADVLMELPERALTEVVVFFLAIMRGANLQAEVEEIGSALDPVASNTGSASSASAA